MKAALMHRAWTMKHCVRYKAATAPICFNALRHILESTADHAKLITNVCSIYCG